MTFLYRKIENTSIKVTLLFQVRTVVNLGFREMKLPIFP